MIALHRIARLRPMRRSRRTDRTRHRARRAKTAASHGQRRERPSPTTLRQDASSCRHGGHARPEGDRHPHALCRYRHVHLRSRASPRPRSCESKITYIDGDEGMLLYRGYPDRGARRAQRLHRDLLSAAQRRAADRRRRRQNSTTHHPPHHGARAARALLPGLPPRRASDGGHVRRGRRAVGLLPRHHRHHRSARSAWSRATG